MAFSANVWKQIKNISKGEFVSALERDQWTKEPGNDAERVYVNLGTTPHKRVSIHFHHSSDTFRDPKLLKNLLTATGWTESDMRRLKLVK